MQFHVKALLQYLVLILPITRLALTSTVVTRFVFHWYEYHSTAFSQVLTHILTINRYHLTTLYQLLCIVTQNVNYETENNS